MRGETLKRVVQICREKSAFPDKLEAIYGEPMSGRTTFKVGGRADCFLSYGGEDFPDFASLLLQEAAKEGAPLFVLGGGANLVVSDSGLRGFVLDTSAWSGASDLGSGCLAFRSGTTLDGAAEAALEAGLSGLEFLAGMPGSIGGALWMNARCYGKSVSDVLKGAEFVRLRRDSCGGVAERARLQAGASLFGYKKSPFQGKECVILEASFALEPKGGREIRGEMEKNRKDRREKGHYLFPCAGSVFKNNSAFGKTIGEIVDSLGLCGLRSGGAQVAPFHGNIIINTGGASARDIFDLKNEVAARVKDKAGFDLEPEIIFAGDF